VNDSAVELFTGAGYTNVARLPQALDPDALREAVRDVHLLGIPRAYKTALARIIDAHHALPIAGVSGDGVFSALMPDCLERFTFGAFRSGVFSITKMAIVRLS
jgi:hypothetical protein